MKTIDKIVKTIKKFDNFLITSHINPEGDSLGSQLAMAGLIRSLGKNFVILNNDKVPPHYRFLPKAKLVQHKIDSGRKPFSAAIVLDCPNLERTGRVKNTVKEAGYIINIDHHVSNELFGDVNWVKGNTSSVGEMIYTLYKKFNCRITRETALYLYISILTDTGSFNYSNTSSATHEIVSELLEQGVEPHHVSKNIYENKKLSDFKLLGKTLDGLNVTAGGRIVYLVVRKKMFVETKTSPLACENFINFARSVKGNEVAIFFREDSKKKNVFHVSFRSSRVADVNKIAMSFGGGGHKNASGCMLKGSFDGIKRKVLKRVKDELR